MTLMVGFNTAWQGSPAKSFPRHKNYYKLPSLSLSVLIISLGEHTFKALILQINFFFFCLIMYPLTRQQIWVMMATDKAIILLGLIINIRNQLLCVIMTINFRISYIFFKQGRLEYKFVWDEHISQCFIFYNNMGNNNNAIETPKSSDDEIANNQKLKPIMFQEFGPPQDTNFKQKKFNRSVVGTPSRFSNQTTRIQTQQKSMMKFSQKKPIEINLKSIHELNQIKDEQGSKIQVPFDVVKLVLQNDLKKSIVERQPQFMACLEKLKNTWQLNSKGYYSNRNGNIITTIKPGYLYQGEYIQNGEIIIPHGNGKLFSREGIFQGEFKDGKAHGNGSYFNRIMKTEYKGVWRKGDLVNGQIIRDDFTFEGRFSQSVADGPGVITFYRQKSSYKGIFKDGLYEDENGYFQSDIYAYSGGFKNGHKDGEGCLIQKQRNIKSVKKSQRKYHPQMEYQGFFQNDCYVGKKKYPLKVTSQSKFS